MSDIENFLNHSQQAPNFPNPIDAMNFLVEEVWFLKNEIIQIRNSLNLKKYTLNDIANTLGCSVSTLKNNPWKIPNYGRRDIAGHPGYFLHKTMIDWYSIPEDVRKERWESMNSTQRREAMGRKVS